MDGRVREAVKKLAQLAQQVANQGHVGALDVEALVAATNLTIKEVCTVFREEDERSE